jgi:hypothetical protein
MGMSGDGVRASSAKVPVESGEEGIETFDLAAQFPPEKRSAALALIKLGLVLMDCPCPVRILNRLSAEDPPSPEVARFRLFASLSPTKVPLPSHSREPSKFLIA